MPSAETIKNRRASRCIKKDNMRIDRATVAAALWAALCTGTGAPSVALRTAKRLVSLTSALLCAEEGRCEVLEAAARGFKPRACCSTIRTCLWMYLNSNSYWSDQAAALGGAHSLASSHLQAGVI